MSDCWSETAQINVSFSKRQQREQKIDMFVQSTCDAGEMSDSALRNLCVLLLLLEHFSQSRFYEHIMSSANSVDKTEKKKEWGNLGIALINAWNQKERRVREECREKGGQSPLKRNETNGFEMLFDAMRFFCGDYPKAG